MSDSKSHPVDKPPRSSKSKGIHSIALATLLMTIGLALSKSTGFLRDVFVIERFTPGVLSDAFYLGFQIPDLVFQLLVGGAIQAAITPTLARSLERNEERNGWRSVSIFITFMSTVMLIVVLFGIFFGEGIFHFFYLSDFMTSEGNRYNEDTIKLAISASRVLFPQVFFMMLAALCIGILNAYKKFTSTAFGPTLYNICVLLSIIILGGAYPQAVINTAIGITVAAAVYFIFQGIMARHELTHFRPSLQLKEPGFRRLFRLAIPTMLSASVVQLNTIIISFFAGSFATGTMTSLRNAITLWQLPYGIFAVAVGNVMLPSLAGHFAAKDNRAARGLLARSLRNALFLTVPSAGLLFIMASDVVYAVFNMGGKYDAQTAMTTTIILRGFCLAIIMHTMIFIYNQAFYAIGKTRIPLFNGLINVGLSSFFCWLFISLEMGPQSLSLAYSLAATVSVLILSTLYGLKRSLRPKSLLPFMIRVSLCLGVLILIVYTLNQIPFTPTNKALELLWLAFRSAAGLGGYLLTARVFQMRELRTALERFDRLRKRRRS